MQQCHYCRRVLEPATSLSRLAYTRDHVVPRAMGGRETVPCCRYCNHLKGDTHLDVWDVFMRDNPEWWTRPELQRMTLAQVMTAGVGVEAVLAPAQVAAGGALRA